MEQPLTLTANNDKYYVMIAGSRYISLKAREYIKVLINTLVKQMDMHILVGDNPHGVDFWVVKTLQAHKVTEYTVYGVTPQLRNPSVPSDKYHQVQVTHYNDRNRFTKRDQFMCDRCNMAYLIWNGESQGTEASAKYLKELNKPFTLAKYART